MMYLRPFLPGVSFLLVVCITCITADAQSPLPRAFEHSYEEIKEAFSKLENAPEGSEQQALLEEISVTYSDKGAMRQSTRRIWKLLARDVGENGILESEFSPWYQNQPTIQARVFDEQGKVYELSEDDVSVSPSQSEDRSILSDNLIVRAALPGLKKGAIVEEVIEVEEKAPFFKQGSMKRLNLDRFVPTSFLSIQVDAPTELYLNFDFSSPEIADLEVKSDTEMETGRTKRLFECKNPRLLSIQDFESFLPRSQELTRQITLGTGRSWQDVAAGYSKVVDGRIKAGDLDSLVAEVTKDSGEAKRSKILNCIHWITQNIRYTGISLGNASIVPARPLQVATRRFGDCKDQATLLVGMLRSLGIEAHVALVNASSYRLPKAPVPALNSFDHAIVYIRDADQVFWVDTTHPGSTLSNIPFYLQGKLVLIADDQQTELTQIPLLDANENRTVEERRLITDNPGKLDVACTQSDSGYLACNAREAYIYESQEDEEKRVQKQITQSLPQATYKSVERSDPYDDNQVVRRSYVTGNLPLDKLSESTHRYDVSIRKLVQEIPYCQLVDTSNPDDNATKRKGDAEVIVPFSWTRISYASPSPGCKLIATADAKEERFGPIRVSRDTEIDSDGNIKVTMNVEVQSGLIALLDLERLAKLATAVDEPNHPLNCTIVIQSEHTVAPVNKRAENLRNLMQAWQQDHEGDKLYDLVLELNKLAQGIEARRIAQQAVLDYPDNGDVQCAYGLSLIHDSFGREFVPGMDREGAEAAFRKAIQLNPKQRDAYFLLNCLLDIDRYGVTTGGDDANKQIIELVDIAKENGVEYDNLTKQKINAMVKLNRFSEAIEVTNQYRIDDHEIAIRCLQSALDSRWSEVEAIRDRLAKSDTLKQFVSSFVEQSFLWRREYKTAAIFNEKFLHPLTPLQEKKLEAQGKLKRVELPFPIDGSVEDVVRTLVVRVASQGLQQSDWSDIIVNPDQDSSSLRLLNICLQPLRNSMRQYSIHQQRMLDVIPFIVGRPEGNDEIGYCCRINPGREDIPFYVVRINQSYRILLEGESSSELAKRAELFQMDGKHAEAIQWVDWAVRKLDAGNPLNAESGTAATVVWNSAKKKKAEMVELVVKMLLHQHRFDPEITAYLKHALETETSKFRKTQIHRCLVQGLAYHGPSDQYEENAKAFFEAYPGLWVEKARLISLLASNGHHDKAQHYLDEHSDSLPAQERTRLEQSVAWAKGDYSDIVQKRLEDTKRQPNAELWNSVLWTSLFADAVDDKLVRQSGPSILKSENPNIIHSLSYAEAETGNLNDAVQELHLILSYRGDTPDGVDWLIVGRIAEQCGLPDAAIESYRKVPKSEDLHSSHFLAQRRIKAIENPREDTTENETKP